MRQMMPEFSGPGTPQWASRALFPAREAWGGGSGGDGGLWWIVLEALGWELCPPTPKPLRIRIHCSVSPV